ncbi:MAG: 50S ribosomal protein L17 [Clostridia bacterium]|nr:50S ribosomal protein L17 [Clostridia bacterium]
MLRSLVTSLFMHGRVTTTLPRAKEAQRMAEKLITKAIHVYDDNVEVEKDIQGQRQTVVNDSPRKLAVRRHIISELYNYPEKKEDGESKYEYQVRTSDVNHPALEKLFRDIAPKFAERAKQLGQGGGYTRVIKLGPRRGDGAEEAILELI